MPARIIGRNFSRPAGQEVEDRPPLKSLYPASDFPPVKRQHAEVTEDHVDPGIAFQQYLQRAGTRARSYHGVTLRFQQCTQCLEIIGVVIRNHHAARLSRCTAALRVTKHLDMSGRKAQGEPRAALMTI